MGSTADIQQQYEQWPYPKVPMWGSVARTQVWQLALPWLRDRCGLPRVEGRPRIWIAGCGTFQPYVLARANPDADILATDLSERSLDVARRRCKVHGVRNVRFAQVDLADREQWPEGPFDLVECYGVLMNLPDAQSVLDGIAESLTPHGIARVMVYPHYSRQRVFQIQRIAKLLRLTSADRSHPGLLRKLMDSLPKSHPLRWAFHAYQDSRTNAGIVDAFLHAGDRGYTAFQFLDLVQNAGLTPGCWFQREWGQPNLAADNLEMQGRSQAFVLNYLDLWQELRSNFVVCLTRRNEPAENDDGDAIPRPTPENLQAHPMFEPDHPELGMRHRLRLFRARWLGTRLPSKVSEPIKLSPSDVRLLRAGPEAWERADARQVARLSADGLLLGAEPWRTPQPLTEPFPTEEAFLAPRLERHRRAANPLYAHLFQAWTLAQRCPELGLPDVEVQMGRWLPHADPLENENVGFGLTPYKTLQRYRVNVSEYLAEAEDRVVAAGWDDVRLRNDGDELLRVRTLLAGNGLPDVQYTDAELRELWSLLMSHESLFVPLL